MLGDASNIQVRRLQSPALEVRWMSEGVTEEFHNNGSGQHIVSWFWTYYPRLTAGVGSNSMTLHTVRADGTCSALYTDATI